MKLLVLVSLIAPVTLFGQAAAISPMPMLQFFDNNGKPAAGFCLQTFASGSTTPQSAYLDSGGTPATNPIILDSAGRASVWLDSRSYKFVLRAKTTGCAGGGGAVLWSVDNVTNAGFALASALTSGRLAIGLTGAPATGTGGGIGTGNALLSATLDGLYVSVNGAPPVALSGSGGGGGTGGAAGGPTTSVQYNKAGALAGTANFVYNDGGSGVGSILTICDPPTAACNANSGFVGPAFTSTATGTIANGTSAPAFTTQNGNAEILANGTAGFQTMGLGLQTAPATGLSGGTLMGDARLSATTAGLYLSLNGAPPVPIGTGGAPGAPATSIQFNNNGSFGGSNNLVWDNVKAILTLRKVGIDSAMTAPIFDGDVTSGGNTFQNSDGTFHVDYQGNGGFRSAGLGLFANPVTGNGGGVNVGEARLSATTGGLYVSINGAAPALLSTGGAPGAPTASVQYNKSGAFTGSANLVFNDAGSIMTVCPAANAACNANSGFVATSFTSTATGTGSANPAFTTQNGNAHIWADGTAGFQSAGVGLLASPVTGAAGGVNVGEARLSATTGGLYVSINGATPALLSTGGAPGAPANSVQYNKSGAFAGTSNLVFNDAGSIMTICPASNVACGANSGFVATSFTSTATGTGSAFTTQTGNAEIFGNGAAGFQNVGIGLLASPVTGAGGGTGAGNAMLSATTTGLFLSLNGGAPVAIGSGVSSLTSAGNGLTFNVSTGPVTATLAQNIAANGAPTFASLALTNGITAGGGAYGLTGAGALTVASCTGCAGAPGGPSTSIQFNNGGVFGGSANLIWDNGNAILTIGKTNGNSSVDAPLFASYNTGLNPAFIANNGAAQINATGNAFFQSICTNGNPATEACTYKLTSAGALTIASAIASGTFTSTATGGTPAFASNGVNITGAGDVVFRGGLLIGPTEAYGLTAGGALTVSSCTGCSAGGSGVTQIASTGNGLAFNQATGSVTASLAQNIATNADVHFNTVTTVSFVSSGCTGTAMCMGDNSGNWSVNGAGSFLGQSISVGSHSTTATQGQGATISNAGTNYAASFYDTGGNCNVGTVYTGGIGCTSDARLKKNVRNLPDALESVNKLRPVTFDWSKNDAHGVGFIAQEIQNVYPGLVTRGDNGYLVFSEMGLVPELVKSIQQLTARVAALEAKR
jgi:hypothetical protein